MKTDGSKTALYARVSKDDMHPENQFADLKRKADGIGQPYDLYEEKESTRETRPIKEELMNKLRRGEYNTLIIWSVDRFARSTKELTITLDELKQLNIRFISVCNNLDFRPNIQDPMQDFQYNILAAFVQLERSFISLRTKAGQARARADGKRIGRHPLNCLCGNCKVSRKNLVEAKKLLEIKRSAEIKPPFSEKEEKTEQTHV